MLVKPPRTDDLHGVFLPETIMPVKGFDPLAFVFLVGYLDLILSVASERLDRLYCPLLLSRHGVVFDAGQYSPSLELDLAAVVQFEYRGEETVSVHLLKGILHDCVQQVTRGRVYPMADLSLYLRLYTEEDECEEKDKDRDGNLKANQTGKKGLLKILVSFSFSIESC